MLSRVVGRDTLRNDALNCRPWSRWLSQRPLAWIYYLAGMAVAEPRTVTSSLCLSTSTRRTQNPLSALWKVTRSTNPNSGSGRVQLGAGASWIPPEVPGEYRASRHLESLCRENPGACPTPYLTVQFTVLSGPR